MAIFTLAHAADAFSCRYDASFCRHFAGDTGRVPDLVVRPPLAARIIAVLFTGGFVCAVAISFALGVARHQDVSGAPAAIGMALFAGTLGYRLAALSYRTRGQEIVIHNYFRTRRVHIAEIEGLDIGIATTRSLLTVRILTRCRAIPVDVLGVMPGIFDRNAVAARGRLERRRQDLDNWLTSAMTDYGPTKPDHDEAQY
jgi:hypothetical protein